MLDDLLDICFKYYDPQKHKKQLQLSRVFYDGHTIIKTYNAELHNIAKKDMTAYIKQFIHNRQSSENDICFEFKWTKKKNRISCVWLSDSLFGFMLVLKLVSVEH